MIARSFKSVAWVAAIGAAALICYIFSMQVAAERASLAELEAQIRRTEQSIRTLKTELGTRGRVHQLQHWSSADFGFTSPKAGQFVADEVTLASFDMPAEPAVGAGPVRMASAPAAPAPTPAAPTAPPKPKLAAAPAPAPPRPAVRHASAPAAAKPAELIRRAAVTTTAPAPRPRTAPPATKPKPTQTARPAATRSTPARSTPPRTTPARTTPARTTAAGAGAAR